MAVTYCRDAPVTASQVADLFRRSGIRRPVDDLPRIEMMLAHANLTLTAWNGDTLIGIARSLTDFAWCCYLSDLAVDKACQGQGVGRELVEQTRQILGEGVTLLLLSAPGAMGYYPRIGFDKIENGWVVPRQV